MCIVVDKAIVNGEDIVREGDGRLQSPNVIRGKSLDVLILLHILFPRRLTSSQQRVNFCVQLRAERARDLIVGIDNCLRETVVV